MTRSPILTALFAMFMLAGVVCVAGGCQPRNDELHLVLSAQIREVTLESNPATDGPESGIDSNDVVIPPTKTRTPVPPDVVAVPTQVQSVSIAVIDSHSISAENSVGRFRVLGTARIPGHCEVRSIVLRYHNALLQRPFKKGQRVMFRFTASGEFHDIEGIRPYY